MGVSKNRDTPKWMVYNGKPYQNGWFGGTIIFGNTHLGKPCDKKAEKRWRPSRLHLFGDLAVDFRANDFDFFHAKKNREGFSGFSVAVIGYWLAGGLKYSLCSSRNLGKWSNLTNILQMGWNHQLVSYWWVSYRYNMGVPSIFFRIFTSPLFLREDYI